MPKEIDPQDIRKIRWALEDMAKQLKRIADAQEKSVTSVQNFQIVIKTPEGEKLWETRGQDITASESPEKPGLTSGDPRTMDLP